MLTTETSGLEEAGSRSIESLYRLELKQLCACSFNHLVVLQVAIHIHCCYYTFTCKDASRDDLYIYRADVAPQPCITSTPSFYRHVETGPCPSTRPLTFAGNHVARIQAHIPARFRETSVIIAPCVITYRYPRFTDPSKRPRISGLRS